MYATFGILVHIISMRLWTVPVLISFGRRRSSRVGDGRTDVVVQEKEVVLPMASSGIVSGRRLTHPSQPDVVCTRCGELSTTDDDTRISGSKKSIILIIEHYVT